MPALDAMQCILPSLLCTAVQGSCNQVSMYFSDVKQRARDRNQEPDPQRGRSQGSGRSSVRGRSPGRGVKQE